MIKHRLEWRDGALLVHLYDTQTPDSMGTIDFGVELSAMDERQKNHFAMVGLRHWLSGVTLSSKDKVDQFHEMERLIKQMQETGKIYNFKGKEI